MRNTETPYISLKSRESEPQGKPKGMREQDAERSECRPVIGRIGIQDLFRPERVLTFGGCFFAR